MVFTSVPVYLDPPNWQQQQNHEQGSSSDNPQPQLPVPLHVAGTGGGGSIRPGSLADRARMAKLPQPETALKCPRCDSSNTKFCYFNNYSLSQPRHFCKTCRRYWTRGGALRNVPVGGGCRRNKRSKGSSSKSSGSAERQSGTAAVPSQVVGQIPSQPPQLPFMASLHHLADYGAADIGLNFGGFRTPVPVTTGGSGGLEIGDQWRMPQVQQQFPFLTGLDPPPGLYPFEGEGSEPPYAGGSSQLRIRPPGSSVKMEENQGLNLSRQFMGNDQFWDGGSAWTDLSGFTSSSTAHLL